ADPPSWIAIVHGWVYFVYLILTADLAQKVRWPIGRTVGTLVAGTIPLLSFFVEHKNAAQVKRDFGVSRPRRRHREHRRRAPSAHRRPRTSAGASPVSQSAHRPRAGRARGSSVRERGQRGQ